MNKDRTIDETKLHLAFVIDDMTGGGGERFVLTIIEPLLTKGYTIDLVLFKLRGQLLPQIPVGVNLFILDRHLSRDMDVVQCSVPAESIRSIDCPTSYWTTVRMLFQYLKALRVGMITWLPPRKRDFKFVCSLSDYLKLQQPDLIWSHSDPTNFSSVLARKISSVKVPIVWSIHIAPLFRGKKRLYLNALIRECHGLHAVSNDVAESLLGQISESSAIRSRITAIYNPINAARILSLAKMPTDHKWLMRNHSTDDDPKTVVALGHLIRRKNFEMLIRAFTRVLDTIDAKLIILGEGSRRESLENLTRELQVDHAISMPGWVANPYSYMSKAHLSVLSSNSEGFSIFLAEALICGCPVVSTDCPNGPREVLADGRWGRLVPVNDEEAMTDAILKSLSENTNRDTLRGRGMSFDINVVIGRYEEFILETVSQNQRTSISKS